MYHARRRNTSRNACPQSNGSSRLQILAQASPVFSVLLCVLCVKALISLRPEKLLTQRTQRSTEEEHTERPRMLPLQIEMGYKWL